MALNLCLLLHYVMDTWVPGVIAIKSNDKFGPTKYRKGIGFITIIISLFLSHLSLIFLAPNVSPALFYPSSLSKEGGRKGSSFRGMKLRIIIDRETQSKDI